MTLTRNQKRNYLAGYSTVAPYGSGRIVARLHPGDPLTTLNLQASAVRHDMTVAEFVSKFTSPLEDWAGRVHESTLVMSRERYLKETSEWSE
jgi:hypothetical protein